MSIHHKNLGASRLMLVRLLLADLSHLSEFTQLDAYPPKVALRARSEIILKLGHGTQQ